MARLQDLPLRFPGVVLGVVGPCLVVLGSQLLGWNQAAAWLVALALLVTGFVYAATGGLSRGRALAAGTDLARLDFLATPALYDVGARAEGAFRAEDPGLHPPASRPPYWQRRRGWARATSRRCAPSCPTGCTSGCAP